MPGHRCGKPLQRDGFPAESGGVPFVIAFGAKITQPEDPAAVGDHDDADALCRPVPEHVRHAAAMLDCGHIQSARALVDVAPLEAGLPNRGRVDDRQQLVEMIEDDAIEQRVVLGLKGTQIPVAFERARFRPDLANHALGLFLQRFHTGREQSFEPLVQAFFVAAGRAFVCHETLPTDRWPFASV